MTLRLYSLYMQIHEKIRHIRKDILNISLQELHARLVDIFGDKALSYYTLSRIESGHRNFLRIKTLYQLCTALGITLKDLREGTEDENSRIVDIVRRSERDEYIYNDKATSQVLSPSILGYLVTELRIAPGGKTKTEEDPLQDVTYTKLVIVNQGALTCHTGSETHTLKKGDTISFHSSIPHFFENISGGKVVFQVIQNPKSY